MNLLLIVSSVVFSLLAIIFIYLIVKQKLSKLYLLATVYLESIVILCLITHQPGYFGLCGVVGIVLIVKRYLS